MHFPIRTTKRFEVLSRPFKALALAAALALFINHAKADRILYSSFETPVVLEGATDPDGWTEGGGHPSYRRAANESGQNWSTPYGEQGMSTYSNGIGYRDLGYMPEESGEYVLKFNVTSSASKAEYRAEILTQEEFFGDPLPEVLVAHVAGDSNGSKNMSFSDQITWRYDYDPEVDFFPKKLLIKLMQDPNRTAWQNTPIWDNVSVDWIPDNDTTGPTVTDMVDDKDGGTVAPNSLVTFTVTFSEDMDASTVNPSDFGNAGSAPILTPVVEQISPQVFLVKVTPTGEGSLRLRINQFAELKDAVLPLGNLMNTSSAIQDNVTITVDGTNPILLPSDIVDDKSGSSVTPSTLVTYTLTFSKDMDATTVDSNDFENAGSAPISFGTVSETSPTSGVFTVPVTPTGPGTLQLQVKNNVLLQDMDGNALDTIPEISDDTTIVVDSTPPTLTDITDDAEGSPVPVGTLLTYDVFFSEDMDASTVDASDFGNAVIVGNAPFTINSVEEASPGVFRIELTPAGAGTIQLKVNAGALLRDEPGNALVTTSAITDDTTVTVTGTASNPYETWSGGLAFEGDENEDGVLDGMAWMLGAVTPSANAIGKLPAASQSSGDLVLTFRCLKSANRGGAVLKVQYSRDMGQADSWHDAEVPDVDATVNTVVFDTSDDGDFINVVATIPTSAAAPGTNLFARLNAVSAP